MHETKSQLEILIRETLDEVDIEELMYRLYHLQKVEVVGESDI
jgi:redox-regulated HSP33 family molecular chaperone